MMSRVKLGIWWSYRLFRSHDECGMLSLICKYSFLLFEDVIKRDCSTKLFTLNHTIEGVSTTFHLAIASTFWFIQSLCRCLPCITCMLHAWRHLTIYILNAYAYCTLLAALNVPIYLSVVSSVCLISFYPVDLRLRNFHFISFLKCWVASHLSAPSSAYAFVVMFSAVFYVHICKLRLYVRCFALSHLSGDFLWISNIRNACPTIRQLAPAWNIGVPEVKAVYLCLVIISWYWLSVRLLYQGDQLRAIPHCHCWTSTRRCYRKLDESVRRRNWLWKAAWWNLLPLQLVLRVRKSLFRLCTAHSGTL